ncbi:MAG: hypothetical protein ACK4PI_09385 [Tepidisphaerales bacterium]
MKGLHRSRRPQGHLSTAVVWAAVASCAVAWARGQEAADSADRLRLRDVEQRQVQVQSLVSQATAGLAQLIDDFETSGLGDGDEARLLRELHGVLGRLTAQQLRELVQLLREARGRDAPEVGETARSAYARQQQVLTELRRLLAEYQRAQSVHMLAEQVRRLAERQHAAMRASIDLARTHGERAGQSSDERVRTALATQAAQQRALAAEFEETLQRLEQLAATAEGETGRRLSGAVSEARLRQTAQQMAQAAGDLQQGALFRAATLQRSSRDGLAAVWRRLLPPRDARQQLADAELALQQLIEQQSQVTRQTEQATTPGEFAAAERRQGDLVDRADVTRSDVEGLAPRAAEAVREAIRQMQQARSQLDRGQPTATEPQRHAAEQLAEARRLLQEQRQQLDAAAAASPAASPADGSRADSNPALLEPSAPADPQWQQTFDQLSRTVAAQRQLEQAIAEQARATEATRQAAGATDRSSDASSSSEAAEAQQTRAAEAAAAAAPAVAAASPEAGQALRAARQSMDDARSTLQQAAQGRGEPAAALPAQQAAGERLDEARSRLAERARELAAALGDDALAAAQRSALMAELARQRDAAESARQAWSQAGQSPSSEAAADASALPDRMQQGAETVRQADARDGALLPPGARASVRAAAEAMQQAAEAGRRGQSLPAAEAAASARDRLDEALSALSAMQPAFATAPSGANAPAPPAPQAGPAGDPRQADLRRDGGAASAGPTAGGDAAAFLALPPREREMLQQHLGERVPPDYAALVEQYLRNLARPAGGGDVRSGREAP